MSEEYRSVYVDTHLHTVASYDGHATPEALLERASTVGLDGVVVTDHDTVGGAAVACELAEGYDDLVVIPGCEVSTAEGHLLAIGVDVAPAPDRPLSVTAESIRAAGGVAVVPHPFQRSRHGAGTAAIVSVDGIEVHNALALTNYRNAQARQFAARNDLPAFAGSDAHTVDGVGLAATELRVPRSEAVCPASVLDAMRAGRTAAVGRRSSTWQYLSRVVDTARRHTASLL